MDVIEMLRERICEEKNKKERAIVFWYDFSAQETVESLQETIANEQVSVREITESNFFKLKIEIEIERPEGNYPKICRNSLKSTHPSFQTAMEGIDVLNMINPFLHSFFFPVVYGFVLQTFNTGELFIILCCIRT